MKNQGGKGGHRADIGGTIRPSSCIDPPLGLKNKKKDGQGLCWRNDPPLELVRDPPLCEEPPLLPDLRESLKEDGSAGAVFHHAISHPARS